MHACNHFRRRQYRRVCAVFVYRTQRVLAVAAQHVGDRAWCWHHMFHAVLWPVTLRLCCLLVFRRFLHAHSRATVGGGSGNAASGRCILAVAAQRVVYRSCSVHGLVSVTVLPCACMLSLPPMATWPCVCLCFLSDSPRPRVVLASIVSCRPAARDAAAVPCTS